MMNGKDLKIKIWKRSFFERVPNEALALHHLRVHPRRRETALSLSGVRCSRNIV
jgi:hypothetical protein